MKVIGSDLHLGNQGASVYDQRWFVDWLWFHKRDLEMVILNGDTLEEWMGRKTWRDNPQFKRIKKLGDDVPIRINRGNGPHDNLAYLLSVQEDLHPLMISESTIIHHTTSDGADRRLLVCHGSEYDLRVWWWDNMVSRLLRVFPYFQQRIMRSLPSSVVQTKNQEEISRVIGQIHERAIDDAVENHYDIAMGHTHTPTVIERNGFKVYDQGSLGMPGPGEYILVIEDNRIKIQNVPEVPND